MQIDVLEPLLTVNPSGDPLETGDSVGALRHCARIYGALAARTARVAGRGRLEEGVRWAAYAAALAQEGVGRYADGTLENVLLDAGRTLAPAGTGKPSAGLTFVEGPRAARRAKDVRHVMSQAYHVGGHTRLVANWVAADPDSVHSVLLTNHSGPVPQRLRDVVRANGGELVQISNSAPYLERARLLSGWISRGEMAILHHHMYDSSVVVGLAHNGCPPTALMNHADHLFGLGSSVADVTLDFRKSGGALSAARRFPRRQLTLPIPLDEAPPRVSRRHARETLGIPAGQVVLVSMGSSVKYAPTRGRNFFAAARRILDRHPMAHLYLIGPTPATVMTALPRADQARIHALGDVEDPKAYLAACDVYLEGYPIGSLTALLEAVVMGGCPVLAPAGASRVLTSDDLALEGIVENPLDEDQYVEEADRLIRNGAERERIAGDLQASVRDLHAGAGWTERVHDVYALLADVVHAPAAMPPSQALETTDDVELSRSRLAQRGRGQVIPQTAARIAGVTRSDVVRLLDIGIRTRDIPLRPYAAAEWRSLFRRAAVRHAVWDIA